MLKGRKYDHRVVRLNVPMEKCCQMQFRRRLFGIPLFWDSYLGLYSEHYANMRIVELHWEQNASTLQT